MPKILVIDDSGVMQRYLRMHLERAGFEVDAWTDPTAAEVETRVAASNPDLIISDYMMPGCNGGTVARMVKRSCPERPVLVLTSFKSDEVDANLYKMGVKRVITKPINPEHLVRAVREALKPAAPATVAIDLRNLPD